MRDILLMSLIVAGCIAALKRPWIGVMVWTWLSIMNPHRFTYGFAYSAPVAQMAAIATFLGILLSKDMRQSPFKGAPAVIFMLFVVWITLSWLMGRDVDGDYFQWKKVMKIDLMLLVALALLHDKRHILALVWTCALSLAILGAKGGLFTVLHGGSFRVWGPPGSFIEDNNEFALALVMTIPLLRFLQLQLHNRWGRRAMTVTMLLLAASSLGSHSRGGLLAIVAMSIVLWWRGRSRWAGGALMLVAGLAMLSFMPAEWFARMETIETYQDDQSAMGRISAWWVAYGIAKTHIFGTGFDATYPDLFQAFSPYGTAAGIHVAHSIYFQVLGHHGFIGLALFLGTWLSTYNWARLIRREAKGIPEAAWCVDLANMCQVAMVGYAVGGAFLSLAYFDLPYNLMVMVVLTRIWVRSRGWEREPVYEPGWWTIPGLARVPPTRVVRQGAR